MEIAAHQIVRYSDRELEDFLLCARDNGIILTAGLVLLKIRTFLLPMNP